jgi:hypothetical protein
MRRPNAETVEQREELNEEDLKLLILTRSEHIEGCLNARTV